jgi:uncharacterized repeat protein (TIGR03847 family)
MSLPQLIELSQVDFITVDTIGPPGQRTFYLQATQDDLLITLIIEKEQAAALAISINGVLERLRDEEDVETGPASPDLTQPVEPLFRVEKLGLGYDEARDMLVIVAEGLTAEEDQQGVEVRIWASRTQMAALAQKAAIVVAAGRPTCPLCHETINPGEEHVCVRDNGRRRLYEVDGK